MLNYDMQGNASVDVLERTMRQLVSESENQFRIDGVKPGSMGQRGIRSHLKRIGEHIIKRGLCFMAPEDVGGLDWDDFLPKIDKDSIIVVEHMRESFVEARAAISLAAAEGYKIVSIYYLED